MSYGYLLAPSFQFVNINGKPLVGGWIEVYVHNDTPIPYITKADFDGTDNPFKVQLNSKGMAVVIAEDTNAYDVYCYDRFGSLFWSGSNVQIGGGGGGGAISAELPLKIVGGVITNNGTNLVVSGNNAWAEGQSTEATGAASHAEGSGTKASGHYAHAEGLSNTASGTKSHAEGHGCVASGDNSHAEGYGTNATKHHSHAEGYETEANAQYSHAEGSGTETRGYSSHSEGEDTLASGSASHAEGYNTTASGTNSHAEGSTTTASGSSSHAEGNYTISSGDNSHAEGFESKATHPHSHAEGQGCEATATASHAEGSGTKASANDSHSEGWETIASGQRSHAEGQSTEASGMASHAGGTGTRATSNSSTAVGKYNDDGSALFVVGDGTSNNARSDAFKVDNNGETWVKVNGVLKKIVSTDCEQFVLVRTDMLSDFTNDEYQACITASSNHKAVCVQYGGNQIQLGSISPSGLIFTQSSPEGITRYTIAPNANAHTITYEYKRVGDADEVDIAPEWSASDVSDYDVGTLVYHDGTLYRCKVSNPSATWVDAEWEQADIAEEIDALKQIRWNGLTPLTSTSNNFRINASGSVESANGYVLNRYYVAGLGGRTIRISADYNSVFSTTDSASGKVTLGLSAGEYIVPLTANYLIVSHTQGSPFDVSIADFEASPSNARSKVHLTYYDSSAGFKIDSSGNAVADANYKLVRYHTDTLANRIVEIETSGNSVFSTSSSASNRVTDALEAGDYVVPINGSYLIISVPNDEEFNVWLITDEPTIGKYGTYGLQMRWSENTTYRLRDSINKSFSIDNATGLITSDFDTCYPWCDMRLCNIENPAGLRTITYQGDAGFTFSKDTYVEIPKFYFKRVFDPNTEYEYWYISSKGGDGFDLEPWFRNADGSEAPVRYVARYNLATSGNISRTGYPAYWNVSKADLKTYCESNDVKLMDINAYQALIHLFVIESGTKDSQSFFKGVSYFRYFTEQTNQQMTNASATTNTIEIPTTDGRNEYFGVGDRVAIFQTASNDFNEAIIRNLTAVSYGGGTATLTFDGAAISLTQGVSRIYGINQLNGRTDGISATSGRTTDGDEHTRSFTYRGIENLWGNLGELVDGITYDYDNHRFKIGNEYVTFETPINRSYIEDTSIPKWIKYFGVDARFPSFTLPCSPLTQSVSTSYTDEWSTFGNESGISDISYGCAWDHQNANGVMCFRNVRDVGNILYTGRAML